MKNELFDDPIPTLVIRKAIPMVFGVFAVLAFSLVDTWFISLLGTEPLAALSFSFPVTFSVSSLAIGMGIGLGSNVGRFLGSGKHHLAARFTTDSLILTTILIALFSICGLIFNDWLFRMLGAEENVLVYIREYMHVFYVSTPMLVLPMVGNAAIRASGDIKSPSVIMLISGLVNGILDPIFIFVFDWGVRGAALATAASWLITLFYAFHTLLNKQKLLTLEKIEWPVIKANWLQLLKIGIPASLAQMLQPVSGGIVIAILSAYGVASVAAYGVGSRLDAIFLIFVMALSSVMPTILGQNYGAKNYRRSGQTIRFTIHMVIGLYFIMYPIVFILAEPLASLFAKDDPAVVEMASTYLRIVPLAYAFLGVGMVASQVMNVLHRPLVSLVMNLMRLIVFLVPFAWIGGEWFDAEGVYWGVASAFIFSGILIYFYVLKVSRDIEKQITD